MRVFRSNRKGYTTVELVMALFILGIVISVLGMLYRMFVRVQMQMTEKNKIHQVLSFSIKQISSTLREARDVVQLGPVTVSGPATIGGCVYGAGNTVVDAMPMQTVHLNLGNRFRFTVPNQQNPLDPTYDTVVEYFIREVSENGQIKRLLYQRMLYYDGTFTKAVPIMTHLNRYREATEIEPTPGGQPTPPPDPTPTPQYDDEVGRIPGAYRWKGLSFDDVAVFYDPFNQMIAVGLTVSIPSPSMSFFTSAQERRRDSLFTTVALRRTDRGGCP